MDITTMGTVLSIVVICYLIGLGAKQIPHIKDEAMLNDRAKMEYRSTNV